jgi:hypothetical protein
VPLRECMHDRARALRLPADSEPSTLCTVDRVGCQVLPMLNPDGVIVGNYRCNLGGVDLNREWHQPTAAVSPEIVAVKEAIRLTCQVRREGLDGGTVPCTAGGMMCGVRHVSDAAYNRSPGTWHIMHSLIVDPVTCQVSACPAICACSLITNPIKWSHSARACVCKPAHSTYNTYIHANLHACNV